MQGISGQKKNNMAKEKQWMLLAIAEARRGLGLTSPNPAVGAVIVKDEQLLGQGWHTGAGRPHAEREAIADVLCRHSPKTLVGSTIYVTLEPCSTHGRTPPCTQGILDAGISRVVYGAEDPNPEHAGAARQILEAAGVEVSTGEEKDACEEIIRAFTKKQRTGLPWVLVKSAMSLDGRISRPPGESSWLTSPESRQMVQQLRFESDAIITGGNTLRIDNPALTLRDSGLPKKTQPWRMVITRGSRQDLPLDHQMFTDRYAERTIVQENGDLEMALRDLAERGCNSVMVEAGGKLIAAMINARLVDEVAFFYAPLLTGGGDWGVGDLLQDVRLSNQSYIRIGDDLLLRASVDQSIAHLK